MSLEFPSPNAVQFLMVFVTVLHSIAIVMTCLRLWVRVRLRRLWWEDAWAALALCLDVICTVSTWTLTLHQNDRAWYLSRNARVISMWLTLLSYTALIWASRMSIVFSLIRMVPSPGRMRCLSSAVAVLFFFLWALNSASKAYTCGSNTAWYDLPDLQCPIGLPIAIIEFITDIVSDVTLVAVPTRILWRMRLPRNERILFISIFSMSLISAMASIIHLVFLIPNPGFMAGMTADIEGALDLMICNLLVLVTALYRIFRDGVDIETTDDPGLTEKPSEDPFTGTQTNVDTLTTVDLDRYGSISLHSTHSSPNETHDFSSRPYSDSSVGEETLNVKIAGDDGCLEV